MSVRTKGENVLLRGEGKPDSHIYTEVHDLVMLYYVNCGGFKHF